MFVRTVAAVLAAAFGFASAAFAADPPKQGWSFGKDQYMARCAPCHGANGKGAGPAAKQVAAKVPDITTFAKRNGGAFPAELAWQKIDGRPASFDVERSMPVWGREFRRLWAENGLWARLLKIVAKSGGVVCLVDGTHIPVHQSGCNPRGGPEHQAMGRTRGGRNSKLMALTDARGRLLAASLVPGQAYEAKHVVELLPAGRRLLVVGDKAYDDDKLRAALEVRGHRHCFPAKSNRREKRLFHRSC